jgi:protein-tyrosine-phosphatase
METELGAGFRQRLARHAALADAGRLRIVDLLTLGDRSPSELQAELGMPSNLLAHHLRILEDAGLAARHRSEADRRRSYIRLVAGSLEDLVPGSGHKARRVLFVCTRNSARSQLAAALWHQASAIPAASAGTHPADRISRGALEVMGEGDFVVTVCDNAHEEVPGLQGVHWSIPDPVRQGTAAAFEEAYGQISHRVSDLAPRLTAA